MHRPHNYHRLENQEHHDQDHEEDDLPPFNITQSTFESSDAKQCNSPALNNDHPPPPLMPLFTPVLQDFQNRFGSSVLQHSSSSSNDPLSRDHNHNRSYHDDHEDPYDQDEQEEEEGGVGNSEYSHQRALSRTNNDSRNDYRQDVGMDASLSSSSSSSSSSRRHHHRAFGGIGVLESNHSLRREGGGGRPLFANNHSPRHDSSGPFFPSSTSGGGGGGNTRISRSRLDIGTDQEAPASLMIEMNQGGHDDDDNNRTYWGLGNRAKKLYKRPGMDAAELAMWKWVNVENLDNFLAKVYDYYVGKGMYTILLERCLNLVTFAFVIGFSTFLVGCVDYPRLRHSKHLDEVLIPQCFHKLSSATVIVLLLFATFWIGQLTRFIYDIPELSDMCNFYTYLLQIPDEDIQTVSWHEVVNRIIMIRDNNPNTSTAATIQTTSTQRLNAHDIANRIMRKENFMIAMFNKELIDLSVPLPMMKHRTILTRILEWSLSFCILGYVFDDRGQVRKRFLKDTRRAELAEGLKRRFQFMGLATLIFAPLISIYLALYFFFRYFEEYHKNPGSIGTRQYTPLAKWKFKEFNELPHLFDTRINASYPLAMKYINQFPKEKTILVCRFVAFISGSFAAVLALMTLFDQELLLGLEITSEKTVFFYLGVFGTIMAVSRGMIPDQTEIFDPELLLRDVVECTHYMPNEWRDKLHTDEVRKQFALLFEYNVMLYALEFMSLALTPLILCLTLPKCSEKVVDFFREFTVHVDGVGYVCSFAVFDFKRHGNVKYGAPAAAVSDDRYISNEGKMEKSFLNFKQNNPDWEPNDPAGSMYLSKLLEADATVGQHNPSHGRHQQRVDHLRQGTWGQSSAYLRRGLSGSSYYHRDPHRQYGMERSRLGRQQFYGREVEDDEDDLDRDSGVGTRGGGGGGVKFNLPSRQRQQEQLRDSHYGHDSESSNYDRATEPIGGGTKATLASTLGDSFVSEIGGQNKSSSSSSKGMGRQGGGNYDTRSGDDMADSFENEQDSRKKGVFGLLNQIYEMNATNL
ncbi:autophagy protein atg9 [Podila horticola]|nr:autophagy protein atg9 [Podila horticola]